MDITLDRSSMQDIKMSNKKFIQEYAQMWLGVATLVNPPLLEKKMVNLFTNTFKTPYFQFLIESVAQHFTNLVIVAKKIEQAIKIGKIKGPVVDPNIVMEY